MQLMSHTRVHLYVLTPHLKTVVSVFFGMVPFGVDLVFTYTEIHVLTYSVQCTTFSPEWAVHNVRVHVCIQQ